MLLEFVVLLAISTEYARVTWQMPISLFQPGIPRALIRLLIPSFNLRDVSENILDSDQSYNFAEIFNQYYSRANFLE